MNKIKHNYSEHPLRKWFILQSLDHPIRTIFISIIATIIMGSGLLFFVIDDDMMRILPKNLESRKSWEALQDEFGSTETIFIAIGNPTKSAFYPEALSVLWDISNQLEGTSHVEEVTSISTFTRMDNDDGFMVIDDLQPYQNLSEQEVQDLNDYLISKNDWLVRMTNFW